MIDEIPKSVLRTSGFRLFFFGAYLEFVDYEPAAEFWLKPGGLGRHDFSAVGNIHDLLHRDGVKGEGKFHLAAIHALLQLAEAAQAAHEIDALIAAQVLDAQEFVENEARTDVYV